MEEIFVKFTFLEPVALKYEQEFTDYWKFNIKVDSHQMRCRAATRDTAQHRNATHTERHPM